MPRVQHPEPTAAPGRSAADDPLGGFDLNLLRVLDALLAARGVSAAARLLGLGQPAVSSALTRLRQALGDSLLLRKGNGMVLTPLAEELRPRVTRLMHEVSELIGTAAVFDPATTRRRFRLAVTEYVGQVMLPRLLAHLHARAPHATFEAVPFGSEAAGALQTREMDLLIGDRYNLSGLGRSQHLLTEHFVCLARAGHPLFRGPITVDAYLAYSHALVSARGVHVGNVDVALHEAGRARRVAVTMPSFMSAPDLLSASDLLITLPSRIAARLQSDQRLQTFKPPLPVPGFEVIDTVLARSLGDPPVVWLREQVSQVARAG